MFGVFLVTVNKSHLPFHIHQASCTLFCRSVCGTDMSVSQSFPRASGSAFRKRSKCNESFFSSVFLSSPIEPVVLSCQVDKAHLTLMCTWRGQFEKGASADGMILVCLLGKPFDKQTHFFQHFLFLLRTTQQLTVPLFFNIYLEKILLL